MSVQAISLVLNESQSTEGARCVLLALANHDGDGGCWPTIRTIAWETNLPERSVRRHLKKLAEMGEIEIIVNRGGTADWREDRRPNLYRIILTPGQRPRDERTPEPPRQNPRGGSTYPPNESTGGLYSPSRGGSTAPQTIQ